MTSAPPELCKHDDPSGCTEECEALAARFDEWVRSQIELGFESKIVLYRNLQKLYRK